MQHPLEESGEDVGGALTQPSLLGKPVASAGEAAELLAEAALAVHQQAVRGVIQAAALERHVARLIQQVT